jgi:FMN phosphatase YigB (HAD superfamily)
MNTAIKHIFWDWHGVLGTKGFWFKSAKEDPEIKVLTDYIFNDMERIRTWMRNDTTIHKLIVESGSNATFEQLMKAFYSDWSDADAINMQLFESIKASYPEARHSIITDNMDVFTLYVLQNKFINETFERVYNSCETGRLKADPESLFEDVLKDLRLPSFKGTLLLDDSLKNCQRFELLGGQAMLIDKGHAQ